MTTCTHGDDCTVHPDARGLHDFTATAEDALRRAFNLAQTEYRGNPIEAIIRAADEMGIRL